MLRPIFLEFPEDPISWMVDTQYMLGPNLMIAPVFNAEGIVSYYVPKGSWYGIIDGKVRRGPGYVEETHDFFSLPVLLRPGSAIAISKKSGLIGPVYDYSNDITILVNWEDGIGTPDIRVEIPESDQDKLGQIKTVVRITSQEGKLRASIEEGRLTGSCVLRTVGGDGVKETEFKEDNGVLIAVVD
jgi:alpha-D-xyloside xylohydrolase